jgi:hypothetical protein
MHRGLALASIALLAFAACGDDDDDGGGPATTSTATFTRVRNEVLNNCLGCHAAGAGYPTATGAAANLDMTGTNADVHGRLVNVQSTFPRTPATRVAPGSPDGSLLYRKLLITNTTANPDPALGAGLPLTAPGSLSQERKDLVRDWIQRGAPND